MKTYFRVLGFARPLGAIVPQYVILTLLHVVFSVINFTVLIPLLEILFDQTEGARSVTELPDFSFSDKYLRDVFYYYFGSVINEYGKLNALYFVCGVILTSVFLSNIFQYLSSLALGRMRVNVITNMRNSVFDKITRFDLGYFTETRKGDIMSRITTDVQQVEATVVSSMKALFKEPLLIFGFFLVLFRMSAELTLYTLLILPISGGVISTIAKRLKKRATSTQESLGRMTNILDESLTGMRIIKAFAARLYIVDKFKKEVAKYGHHNFKMIAKSNLAGPVSEFLGVAFVCLILLIGGRMVIENTSPLGASEFIGFIIIFSQILNPAKSLSNAFSQIQRGIASGERVFSLMDTNPKIKDVENPIDIDELKESIEFRNVSFSYGEKEVLTDINFTIPKGNVVALVGPSGGGKSTIADLIPRFYDTKAGDIIIDGHNIKEYRLNDLRKMMGIVTQESILFNDTVFQNIAFGKPNATMEEVEVAAKIANAYDFIEKLDQGFDTLIGERGTKLSGGQRQRISIARAILKNPPILILDEATSALDSESEKLVQQAIYNLMKNRTTLVIAHRLSTIQNADEIIVVQQGKIVQRGKHIELMNQQGMYNKLIEMQSF